MRYRLTYLALALCLTLTGCTWMDRSYYSVTPHQQESAGHASGGASASNYLELCDVLEELITTGAESAVIHVADYNQSIVERGMDMAVRYARNSYPLGAYAVEDIKYELGASGGVPAIAVKISYRHSRVELRQIRTAADMEAARALIGVALENCDAGIVILVENYSDVDMTQIAEDYALLNPDAVMEIPQVTQESYPETGQQRVLELKFTYQTSREDLRQMKNQVRPVFDAAALYVSGDGAESQKYSQLYAFLMERFPDYQIKTSITPSYSLLRHGVGDSKAFAVVYAEMCRRAGLECRIVIGTRGGEPWCWNMIRENGYDYHVDLLRCQEQGGFAVFTDRQMENYVWDYSAYPECGGVPPAPPEQTEPPTEPPETTIPVETAAPTENSKK